MRCLCATQRKAEVSIAHILCIHGETGTKSCRLSSVPPRWASHGACRPTHVAVIISGCVRYRLNIAGLLAETHGGYCSRQRRSRSHSHFVVAVLIMRRHHDTAPSSGLSLLCYAVSPYSTYSRFSLCMLGTFHRPGTDRHSRTLIPDRCAHCRLIPRTNNVLTAGQWPNKCQTGSTVLHKDASGTECTQ